MEIKKIEDITENLDGQFFCFTEGEWKTATSSEACYIKKHKIVKYFREDDLDKLLKKGK